MLHPGSVFKGHESANHWRLEQQKQTLYEHAVREAEKFTGPDAQKYKDAAKKVRMP